MLVIPARMMVSNFSLVMIILCPLEHQNPHEQKVIHGGSNIKKPFRPLFCLVIYGKKLLNLALSGKSNILMESVNSSGCK